MLKSNSPSVAVLILTYNNEEDVEACLASVATQDYGNFSVHIRDNASTDGTVVALERSGFSFARSLENEGYARGMNAMLVEVDADYIIFLNADCRLGLSFISRAVERLDESPDVGVLAPLVWRLDPCGALDAGPISITTTMRVRVEKDVEQVRYCQKANGACAVYRGSALRELAVRYGYPGFDELYDTYGEDIDLALRLSRQGWDTLFDPAVVASHRRSGSSGAVSVFDKRGRLRVNVIAARHLNVVSHLKGRQVAVLWPVVVAQDVALLLLRLSRGDGMIIRDVGRAWIRVFRTARKKRRSVQMVYAQD